MPLAPKRSADNVPPIPLARKRLSGFAGEAFSFSQGTVAAVSDRPGGSAVGDRCYSKLSGRSRCYNMHPAIAALRLRPAAPAAIVRAVNFSRTLLLLLAACALVGCETAGSHQSSKKYRRVRVTDPRGDLIADWTAEGFVARTERGYRFRAVERVSGPPFVQVNHYPRGRRIVVTPAGKPLWLYQLHGY